jgi:hypothetical protein
MPDHRWVAVGHFRIAPSVAKPVDCTSVGVRPQEI